MYKDGYKRQVIEMMKKKGWSVSKAAKHFHHSWTTIEDWLKEYGEIEPEDANEIDECERTGKAKGRLSATVEERMESVATRLAILRERSNDVHVVNIEQCPGCIRLQAELDTIKAMHRELIDAVLAARSGI